MFVSKIFDRKPKFHGKIALHKKKLAHYFLGKIS